MMNHSKLYITQLIEKFNEGQTTESEEQILAEYFASAEDIPSEWIVYKDMFEGFASGAFDFTEDEISSYLTPHISTSQSRKPWGWVSAACVACMAGLLWLFWPAAEVEQEISVADLCNTMSILSQTGRGQIDDLSATPSGNGFVIKTTMSDGKTCSFTMQRTQDGFAITSL